MDINHRERDILLQQIPSGNLIDCAGIPVPLVQTGLLELNSGERKFRQRQGVRQKGNLQHQGESIFSIYTLPSSKTPKKTKPKSASVATIFP